MYNSCNKFRVYIHFSRIMDKYSAHIYIEQIGEKHVRERSDVEYKKYIFRFLINFSNKISIINNINEIIISD